MNLRAIAALLLIVLTLGGCALPLIQDDTTTEVVTISLSILPGRTITEGDYNNALCAQLGGRREVRHYYHYGGGERGYVVVDCETDFRVIEGGLDKRSSLDSVQQALFAAVLTGKEPTVAIYDTDGAEGGYEYRIHRAARKARVGFIRVMRAE